MGAPQPFNEVRLPTYITDHSTFGPSYLTIVSMSSSGAEKRVGMRAEGLLKGAISFGKMNQAMYAETMSFFRVMSGRLRGWRFRDWLDYKATDSVVVPRQAGPTGGGTIQLSKRYFVGTLFVDRKISKPTSTTIPVAAGVGVTMKRGAGVYTPTSIDYTAGIVSHAAADNAKSLTAATKAASAVLTVGASHGFIAGELVHLSGVVGMTQLNGRVARITSVAATTITIALDSTTFTTYTSGGTVSRFLKSRPITAITLAASAVVTVGASHGFAVNDMVYFTGILGMVELNGIVGVVTATAATTITVNVDTTLFSAYTSGGYADETLSWSGEFDVPVRFDTDSPQFAASGKSRSWENIGFQEQLL